jgi:hypothetical protein
MIRDLIDQPLDDASLEELGRFLLGGHPNPASEGRLKTGQS